MSASTLELPAATIADLLRLDEALRRLDAGHCAAVAADAGDLAVLDDVHAVRVGAAREAPRDRIVPRHAAAPLHRRAQHRIAAVRLMSRHHFLDLRRREQFGIDAVEPVRVARGARCRACPAACARGSSRRAG